MTQTYPAPCPGRAEAIYLLLDGELHPTEQAALLSHLPGCSACQSLLAELEGLFTELTTLPEAAPPPELVNRVMAHLPAPQPVSRRVPLSQWVLLGQIVVGIALLLLTAPAITTAVTNPLIWQPWFSLSEITMSLLVWLRELFAGLAGQVQWPSSPLWPIFSLSPLGAGGIVIGLVLAWFIGNGLLLRRYPTSFKNGGVS